MVWAGAHFPVGIPDPFRKDVFAVFHKNVVSVTHIKYTFPCGFTALKFPNCLDIYIICKIRKTIQTEKEPDREIPIWLKVYHRTRCIRKSMYSLPYFPFVKMYGTMV